MWNAKRPNWSCCLFTVVFVAGGLFAASLLFLRLEKELSVVPFVGLSASALLALIATSIVLGVFLMRIVFKLGRLVRQVVLALLLLPALPVVLVSRSIVLLLTALVLVLAWLVARMRKPHGPDQSPPDQPDQNDRSSLILVGHKTV